MKKNIILGIVLVISIVIIIIGLNNNETENKNTQKGTEGKNTITSQEITERVNENVKEKLEQGGLILEGNRTTIDNNLGVAGTLYKVYLNEEDEQYSEIQVFKMDIHVMTIIGTEAKDGEITIEDETYWKYGSIIIKLSENNDVNKIIKNTMK